MIFFDYTGKRWRNIKLSAAGLAVLVFIPVAALVTGSLIYQPKWRQLPVISQASEVLSAAGQIAAASVVAPAPPPSHAPTPAPRRTTTRVATKATPVTASVLGAATTKTRPAATPAPTVAPTPTPAPGKSGSHGHSTPSPH